MSKFALVASTPRPARENGMIFLATMTPSEFKEAGYCGPEGIQLKQNPRADAKSTHPTKLFMAFSKDGEQFTGSVSHNIKSVEDITKPMISIVEVPNAEGQNLPREERIRTLFHNAGDNAGAPTLATF